MDGSDAEVQVAESKCGGTVASPKQKTRGQKAKLARRNTAGFEKLQKARGKLNIMRILGGPEPTSSSVDQMSHDLQQLLNKSVDLYATDVCKWVKIFWSDPILERRVDALSEIGWGAYLCGQLLQNDLARSEGFLEGVLKVARTMCGRPVPPMLRATMVTRQHFSPTPLHHMLMCLTAVVQLHSIGLMCRDCFVFQERALDVGILSVASDCAHYSAFRT